MGSKQGGGFNNMNQATLITHIEIIFEREKILLSNNEISWSIKESNNNAILIYEHAITLINLYEGLSNIELKNTFVDYLSKSFVEDNESVFAYENNFSSDVQSFSSTTALIFFVLLALGFKDKLIDVIKTRQKKITEFSDTNITLMSLLLDLSELNDRFLDLDIIPMLLHFIHCQIPRYSPYDDELKNKLLLSLTNIGYEKVKGNILNTNIEINKDKEKLISIFSSYGFDNKYAVLLQEIDEYINTNSTIVSSGMIGNMRSFMEDLIIDLARKISANLNEQIPERENSGPMGNNRNYLKMKLELSDNDNNLINKYIDILHSEGGHSFTSNIEYFRLAKNIGIEISLFLLSKADNLKILRSISPINTDIDF
jgi:hypothetical protein